MAVKPKIVTLTNSSVDVLNAIRNSATTNYKDYVPVATADAESIKTIGSIIMDMPQLQNEFIQALINRIGRVVVTSKLYSNPWAMFKKGVLEMGESMEEIFVNIAKPFTFDPEVAEETVWKREIPDVRSAFHVMNYKKYYKDTVSQAQLKQAFLSWDGVTDLISKIVNSMYTAANYDEFLTMKYLLARHILNGELHAEEVPTVSTANMKGIVSTIKGISNDYEFLSNEYNLAGVYNNSLKDEQYIIVNAKFDAIMDVEVLASAFNMDKASFMGHRVLIDGFGKLDNARLAELFADDPTYVEITEAELTALNEIPAVLVDRDYFMVYDNFMEFDEIRNGEGLYWNYWFHVWKTFSVSPFANTAVFVPTAPSVTGVTMTPATATIPVGGSVALTPTVATTGFASKTVTYSTNNENATVNASGVVTGVAKGACVITATSVFDTSKKATATITIS